MKSGICFIISAPSGTGKSSLISSFLSTKWGFNARSSISYTTRSMRPGEKEGQHYYFISKKKFETMINKNIFLEYAVVFNNYYGTSRILIEKMLSEGNDVILDIDWQGARQIRNYFSHSISIFILPPSKLELYNRLKKRGQNTDLDIKHRIKKAVFEISHYKEYDYLIVNDNFTKAVSDLKSIIISHRLSLYYQKYNIDELIKSLCCIK
ncbi:Guanylate kinase [Buchnera aphidicola (Thelaxes suberi)]